MAKNKYHLLYYIGLIYLIFPLSEGVKHHPFYLTIPTLVFASSYISLIYLKPKKRVPTAILWFYLIVYIFYTTCLIEGSMSWFLSGIIITIENHLSGNFLDPKLESALVMISRELSTNIIKHAKAKTCQLDIKKTDDCYVVSMTDDGIGFIHLDGQELHSIRERLHTLKGNVEIISRQAPTLVRVTIDERIF